MLSTQRLRVFAGLLACACALITARAAQAQVCFPTPVALPGLSGPPDWKAPGTVRTELNEPRWAAGPQTAFASDATSAEGRYRLVVNSSFNELSVSFQAPTDPSTPTNADAIYFGFTTDGLVGNAAKGIRIKVSSAGTDPIDATLIDQFTYTSGGAPPWSSSAGAPTWLKEPAVWIADSTAAWGINFKIDLSAAAASGLSVSAPFKILLAMHKEDEANVPPLSVDVSTPNPNAAVPPLPLLAGTLFIDNPANWAATTALNAGCADGITLDSSQIGTRNVDMGNPAPNEVNTTSGAVNNFYATPTFPVGMIVTGGMIQAKFHVANWGSIAASNAPWTVLPNGAAVLNGAAPAPNAQTLEFACPANTATQTCGIPTPAVKHQCVYVELQAAPGHTVPFTKAAAYRNMEFKPLSNFSAAAEISVKGLKALLGNDNPRDVYVYVYAKNMPAHGNEPIWLPTDVMAATRRFAETPPLVRQPSQVIGAIGVKGANPAPATKPGAAAAAVGERLREIPTPNTGIRDLDLTAHQALSSVWPTYDVHVYYDTGRTITIDKKVIKQLAPMFPFTYFHSHQGPLFGFSHSLNAVAPAVVKELRHDVFFITIPSESAANVTTAVAAEEKPKDTKPPLDCSSCPPPGGKNPHCGCSLPGAPRDRRFAILFAASAAGILGLRRKRPSRK